MDDLLRDISITAERVERFRELHEGALADLRAMVTEARAEGVPHHFIAEAIGADAPIPGRFERAPDAFAPRRLKAS